MLSILIEGRRPKLDLQTGTSHAVVCDFCIMQFVNEGFSSKNNQKGEKQKIRTAEN